MTRIATSDARTGCLGGEGRGASIKGRYSIEPDDDLLVVRARNRRALVNARPIAHIGYGVVTAAERGNGIGTALVGQAHQALDSHGVGVSVLNYAAMNPLSGPFWHRMGYRPVWTTWEVRPALALR